MASPVRAATSAENRPRGCDGQCGCEGQSSEPGYVAHDASQSNVIRRNPSYLAVAIDEQEAVLDPLSRLAEETDSR
jgi:hypothetical protein